MNASVLDVEQWIPGAIVGTDDPVYSGLINFALQKKTTDIALLSCYLLVFGSHYLVLSHQLLLLGLAVITCCQVSR